jgi:hypothetical protein
MKPSKFIITFATGIEVTVYAFGEKEAVILAQADQINAGNQWKRIARIDVIKAEGLCHT